MPQHGALWVNKPPYNLFNYYGNLKTLHSSMLLKIEFTELSNIIMQLLRSNSISDARIDDVVKQSIPRHILSSRDPYTTHNPCFDTLHVNSYVHGLMWTPRTVIKNETEKQVDTPINFAGLVLDDKGVRHKTRNRHNEVHDLSNIVNVQNLNQMTMLGLSLSIYRDILTQRLINYFSSHRDHIATYPYYYILDNASKRQLLDRWRNHENEEVSHFGPRRTLQSALSIIRKEILPGKANDITLLKLERDIQFDERYYLYNRILLRGMHNAEWLKETNAALNHALETSTLQLRTMSNPFLTQHQIIDMFVHNRKAYPCNDQLQWYNPIRVLSLYGPVYYFIREIIANIDRGMLDDISMKNISLIEFLSNVYPKSGSEIIYDLANLFASPAFNVGALQILNWLYQYKQGTLNKSLEQIITDGFNGKYIDVNSETIDMLQYNPFMKSPYDHSWNAIDLEHLPRLNIENIANIILKINVQYSTLIASYNEQFYTAHSYLEVIDPVKLLYSKQDIYDKIRSTFYGS